ncbi:hypothetical protein [Alistipes sp.]|uniref:hypothetical protein n=1 Tax=Alistipes sp. TaxID=1872444 RepID=UPI003AF1A823
MMTRKEIEALLERYFAAETTPDEERQLRGWFRAAKDLPPDLRYAQTLFAGLEELSEEQMPRRAGRPRLRRVLRPVWYVAVAAVVAIGIFVGAELLRKPYCYIDGRAVYDRETALAATAYLDGLSRLDDPARMVDRLLDNPENR